MKTYAQLVNDCLANVKEIMPWDLEELVNSDKPPMLIALCDRKQRQNDQNLEIPRRNADSDVSRA